MLRTTRSLLLAAFLAGAASSATLADDSLTTKKTEAKPPVPTHFLFFDAADGRPTLPPEELQKIQGEHLANLSRLFVEGKSPLAGPLGRESKKTRGIVVLVLDKPDSLASEFANDPYVEKGHLELRAYPWKMTTGTLRKAPANAGLGEYVLGVVRLSEGVDRKTGAKAYASLESRLASKEIDGGPKPLSIAGAIDSRDDDVVGILLFRISSIEKARELTSSVPAVADKTLRVELFRQYLGKGIID